MVHRLSELDLIESYPFVQLHRGYFAIDDRQVVGRKPGVRVLPSVLLSAIDNNKHVQPHLRESLPATSRFGLKFLSIVSPISCHAS